MSSSGTHIQLPFGVARDNNEQNYIKVNLPPDYRKDTLFEQLPNLAQLDNPAIADVVKNRIVDNIALQKYLMATGLLINSIQDSLNMIMFDDGKLSNAAVMRKMDTKFLLLCANPSPSTLHWTKNHIFFSQTFCKDGLSKKIEPENDISYLIRKDDISFSRKFDLTP